MRVQDNGHEVFQKKSVECKLTTRQQPIVLTGLLQECLSEAQGTHGLEGYWVGDPAPKPHHVWQLRHMSCQELVVKCGLSQELQGAGSRGVIGNDCGLVDVALRVQSKT